MITLTGLSNKIPGVTRHATPGHAAMRPRLPGPAVDVFFGAAQKPPADAVPLKSGGSVSLKEAEKIRARVLTLLQSDSDTVFTLWAKAKNRYQAVPPLIEKKLVQHQLMEPDGLISPGVAKVVLASFAAEKNLDSTIIRWLPHPYDATLDEVYDIAAQARPDGLPDTVTLRTREQVSSAKLKAVRAMILRLLNGDKPGEGTNLACFKLWQRARDANYKIDDDSRDILVRHGLMDGKGNIPADTARIVLASFQENEPTRLGWVEAGRVSEAERKQLLSTVAEDSLEVASLIQQLAELGDAGLDTLGTLVLMGLTGGKVMGAYRLANDLPDFVQMVRAYDPVLSALAKAPDLTSPLALPLGSDPDPFKGPGDA